MRRPISVITGIRRAVNGSKEVAKCVAVRRRQDVAWSIEAAFPVVGQSLLDTVTSQERPLNLQAVLFTRRPTQAGSWTTTRRKGLKPMAPERSHPATIDRGAEIGRAHV